MDDFRVKRDENLLRDLTRNTSIVCSRASLHDNGLGWLVARGTEVPDLELARGARGENLHLHGAG